MALQDVINEAKQLGFGEHELNNVRHEYMLGVMQYYAKNPQPDYSRFRSALAAIHKERTDIEFVAEAYARKYIRTVQGRNKPQGE
jgi:hypothetical protein